MREALAAQAQELRAECLEGIRTQLDEERALRASLGECLVDLGFYQNLHYLLFFALALSAACGLLGWAAGARAARATAEPVAPLPATDPPALNVRIRDGRAPGPGTGTRQLRLG